MTPTSGSAITQTLTVTLDSGVTVNPSNPGIAVTNQILGMNLAAWYNWPANASLDQLGVHGAGIKAIRWPGGSWSDDTTGGTSPAAARWYLPVLLQFRQLMHRRRPPTTADTIGQDIALLLQFVSAIPQAGPL